MSKFKTCAAESTRAQIADVLKLDEDGGLGTGSRDRVGTGAFHDLIRRLHCRRCHPRASRLSPFISSIACMRLWLHAHALETAPDGDVSASGV